MDPRSLAAGLAPRFLVGEARICRLLFDPPADGAWNMAVDEVLLDHAARTGQVTLRFYGWREPTVSLGYFQSHAERSTHAPSSGCPLVRRPTGGGAIVHDNELTYSLTIPSGSSRPSGNSRPSHKPGPSDKPGWPTATALGSLFNESLIEVLGRWGVAARQHCDAARLNCEAAQTLPAAEAFLCFERRAGGDVVCGNVKIAGSAQRRLRTAVLQHGSLLLAASRCAPHLPGLADLSGIGLSADSLAEALASCLAKRLHLRFERTPLESQLSDATERLARDKYLAEAWNHRR